MAHMFDNPAILVQDHFVGEKWVRLNEILQDFSPEFYLAWIPPEKRENRDTSKPYAVVHEPSNGKPSYIVMFAGELDDPASVLARLIRGDTRRRDVMGDLEASQLAQEAFDRKQKWEAAEEAMDQARFLAASPKNYIKWKTSDGKLVTLDSNRRRINE